MVDLRDKPKLKRIFQSKIFWSKYNIHGFWDSTNEYSFEHLNQTFPDNENNSKIERYHAVKIYYAQSKKIDGKHPWGFPFIDIFYYKQNLSHVWQLEPKFGNLNTKIFTPISEFYPFHLRPFMGMWLKVPHKPGLYLKRKYPNYKCGYSWNWWNHKLEKRMNTSDRVIVPCEALKHVYVEISRTDYLNGTLESVYLSKTLLYSVFIDVEYETSDNPPI